MKQKSQQMDQCQEPEPINNANSGTTFANVVLGMGLASYRIRSLVDTFGVGAHGVSYGFFFLAGFTVWTLQSHPPSPPPACFHRSDLRPCSEPSRYYMCLGAE